MPSSVYYGTKKNGKYVITDNVKYAYDKMGNIEKIYENGALKVRYVYDAMNRLIREDNKAFGKTWLYSYDNKGNILCKRTTDFTLKENAEENEYTSTGYTYEGDRLVGYGNETIEYDAMGNPTTYRGKSLEWNWRHLTKYNGMSLQYDNVYQRIKRGEEEYVYDSQDRIVKKSGAEFLYDDAGVSGIKYEGATYMYRRDGQGNIVALIDSSGNVVVKYEYDAWGNHEVYDGSGTKITQGTHVGRVNPYRYRGYYYDEELKLYYLKTRYYDPEVGRFINADDVTYIAPETINGLNLYAYCGNNPVMRIDPNGCAWWNPFSWDWGAIGRFIGGGLLVLAGALITVGTLPIALAFPGGGFLTQVGFSTMMYGAFMVKSAFDSDIKADMDRIGWNPFNSNEDLVLASKKVSFYKGMPTMWIKHSSKRSGSFLGIWLNIDGSVDADTVKHEWGHGIQQGILGPLKFGLLIGLPSALEWSDRSYYTRPWEITADLFGGASRPHLNSDMRRGKWYLAVSSAFGIFAYFFLIGEN